MLQLGFALVTLPHEAYYSLDAILRTLGRMLFTHQRLLEWNPSGDQERASRSDLSASFRTMWFAPALAVGTAGSLAVVNPAALAVAGPSCSCGCCRPPSPGGSAGPLARREARLTAEQTRFLGRIARKTWAFFETFVGPDDHWLPPDNYQEYRAAALAHRTSPTNMGLALLANLSAYDFGYLPAGSLLERTAQHPGDDGRTGTPPGPLLQLVRHADAATPAPRVRLDGGQRQPGGPSADPAAGPARAARPTRSWRARWLDGLGDTLGILEEAAGEAAPAAWPSSGRRSNPGWHPGRSRWRRLAACSTI